MVAGAAGQLRSSSSTPLPRGHKHGRSQISLQRQHPMHRDSNAALATCPPNSYSLYPAPAISLLRFLHVLPPRFIFEWLLPKQTLLLSSELVTGSQRSSPDEDCFQTTKTLRAWVASPVRASLLGGSGPTCIVPTRQRRHH